jgi:WD40 repeat protein
MPRDVRRKMPPSDTSGQRGEAKAKRGLRFRRKHDRVGKPRSGYQAFISYSHALDGKLAPILQQALQRFAKPWYRLWVFKVFRDQTSLSANPGLWSSIRQALAKSEYFILLASPIAAKSEWVGREVEEWATTKNKDRFLIALTDGEVAWDPATGEFDPERTTALPPSIRGQFSEEPRYVDLRWVRTATDLSLRNPMFSDAIADLAAPLHGRPKDELIGEEVRQHRRTRRLVRLAIALLTALALLAGTSAFVALTQRNQARRQRDIATSRQLAAQSVTSRKDRLDRSLLLSLEALRFKDTVEARSALLGGLESAPELTGFLYTVEGSASSLAFSPDGKTLASGEDGKVVLWDIAARRRRFDPLTGYRGPVIAIAFSSDGKTLAAADANGTIIIWDVRSHRQLGAPLKAHRGTVNSVAFRADASMVALATNDKDKGVVIWDLGSRTEVGRLPPAADDVTLSVAFSPDGRTLAYGSELSTIRFWDVLGRRPLPDSIEIATGDYSQRVSVLAFSPDGNSLASAGGGGGGVNIWDVRSRQGIGGFGGVAGQTRPVTSLAFSPDGYTLAFGSLDKMVRILGPYDGLLTSQPMAGQGIVTSLAFRSDGLLASASQEGVIALWDLGRSVRLANPLDFAGASEYVASVAFSPDDTVLASSTFEGIILWDVKSGAQVDEPLIAGEDPFNLFVNSVVFSPDGQTLASGGDHGSIVLWDVARHQRAGKPLSARGGAVNSVAFSPDGQILASGGDDGSIVLWDVARHQRAGEPLPPTGDTVDAVAFSPDGRTLASAAGKAVALWDVSSGQELGEPLPGTRDFVVTLAFSHDGNTLAWGSYSVAPSSELLVLWDASLDSWQRKACALVNRNLTQSEWDRFVGGTRRYAPTCSHLPAEIP